MKAKLSAAADKSFRLANSLVAAAALPDFHRQASFHFHYLRQGDYVFARVCLFVCLCVLAR